MITRDGVNDQGRIGASWATIYEFIGVALGTLVAFWSSVLGGVRRGRLLTSYGGMAAAAIVLSGCASVVVGGPAAKQNAEELLASERTSLKAAGDAIAQTPWRKPQQTSLGDKFSNMFGSGDSAFSKSDTISDYIETLRAEDAPSERLKADAEMHLAAADNLILVANEVLGALSPRMSDVDILETAIADLRGQRGIYVQSLKILDGENSPARTSLSAAFDAKISHIGALADDLADRCHANMQRTLARPGSSVASNLSGS